MPCLEKMLSTALELLACCMNMSFKAIHVSFQDITMCIRVVERRIGILDV